MTNHNVVIISPEGVILGSQEYDSINDGRRDDRVCSAAIELAERTGLNAPRQIRNSALDESGNEWSRMRGDFLPGMVEIKTGQWGFSS